MIIFLLQKRETGARGERGKKVYSVLMCLPKTNNPSVIISILQLYGVAGLLGQVPSLLQ